MLNFGGGKLELENYIYRYTNNSSDHGMSPTLACTTDPRLRAYSSVVKMAPVAADF